MKDKERERNINVRLPLALPIQGNLPAALWFTVRCSIYWATPARAIYLFLREGERARKTGREISMCERSITWFPLARPQPGTWPATRACALTGNRTGDLSVCGMTLNPPSYTSQGTCYSFNWAFYDSIFSCVLGYPLYFLIFFLTGYLEFAVYIYN